MSRGKEAVFARPPEDWSPAQTGMTIREYFAAQAMQGLLANVGFGYEHRISISEAVKAADALLLELEKPTGEQS